MTRDAIYAARHRAKMSVDRNYRELMRATVAMLRRDRKLASVVRDLEAAMRSGRK